MDVTDMEDRIDQAARRTAINLMRLNEALEMHDADAYSPLPHRDRPSAREHRQNLLRQFYKRWFTGVAREPEAAEEARAKAQNAGSGSRRLENMEDSR